MSTRSPIRASLFKVLLTVSLTVSFGGDISAETSRKITVPGITKLISNTASVSSASTSHQISPVAIAVPIERGLQAKIIFDRSIKVHGLKGGTGQRVIQGRVTYSGKGVTLSAGASSFGMASAVIRNSFKGNSVDIVFETRGARRLSKRISVIHLSGDVNHDSTHTLRIKRESRRRLSNCATEHQIADPAGITEGLVRSQQVREIAVLLEGDSEFFRQPALVHSQSYRK